MLHLLGKHPSEVHAGSNQREWTELAALARQLDELEAQIVEKEKTLARQRHELLDQVSHQGRGVATTSDPTVRLLVDPTPMDISAKTNPAASEGLLHHSVNDESNLNVALRDHVRDVLKLAPASTIIFTAATKGFIRGVVNWLALLYVLASLQR